MSQIDDVPPWWMAVDPAVERLARTLCHHWISPDQMVLPYQAAYAPVPNGVCTLVPPHDMAPAWTCYVTIAKMAMEAAEAAQVDAATDIGLVVDSPPHADAPPPLAKWRMDRGLDPAQG